MIRNLLIIISLISFQFSIAQIQGRVIDSNTNNAISFTSIWMENGNSGTTSDKNGIFQLNKTGNSEIVVFSAIGYETKRVEYNLLVDNISLNPILETKNGKLISSRKKRRAKDIGQYNKSNIKRFFGASNSPGMTARFFEYNNSYSKTPFLNKITVLTSSDIPRAKFLIKLYNKDSTGKPGDFLYNKNIIGIARRGKRSTKIDISDLNIKFPKNGLFVAIEWLIIEDNKFEYSYISPGRKGELKDISYEPAIGVISSLTVSNTWSFIQGKWIRIPKDPMNNEFKILAMKLELSD
ncbi:carboxypeptidase-like regulatory domain-containing protein [Gillisia sp. M10.2A]|uniref:Carboxypeptidase-like regulatory domain-containing protein n=1 Tax=Gillisia lutea TaxID=2909668 RepID=A0ABS9EG86_9FLAO|nr:carboxypeptidase-like regulatory domain-containing protein [Gillisia lutea]MCF4101890.1 carboxypeptidase-like regulatory domain-containing protein [Gillisia lutea]